MKVIFWDFDGVIIESNEIRSLGFKTVLKEYPIEQVEKLLEFHNLNGGLSRYVKFRYFFENVRNESLTDDMLEKLCLEFSCIMKDSLADPKLLIPEVLTFIDLNYSDYNMYIVSGSDQNELRDLCSVIGIKKYFKGIYGSPTPKNELVKQILDEKRYLIENCVLIGDSINDFEAAQYNKIDFQAYNNESLIKYNTNNNQIKLC